jgi:hypothetical protein
VGAVGLGDDEQPRGVLVDAVDEAGRSSPPPGASPWPRPTSALTSVPVQLPGAGWTTMPAGLSTTTISSSS